MSVHLQCLRLPEIHCGLAVPGHNFSFSVLCSCLNTLLNQLPYVILFRVVSQNISLVFFFIIKLL